VVLGRAAVIGLLLLAPGCKQSLFDAHTGDSDAAQADARPGPDGPVVDAAGSIDGPIADANPLAPDADDTDAAIPDAAVPATCPTTCIADLVENYDGTAGGSNGLWRYLDDQRDRTWVPLTDGTWNGLTAKVGGGSAPTPAIVDCRSYPSDAACTGVDDRILLVPSQGSAGHHDPATEVAIGDDQQYQMSGRYRSDATGTAVHELRFYRNTYDDLVKRVVFDADAADHSYSFPVEAIHGDRLLMALYPQGTATGTPVGVEEFVSRNTGAFPGACGATVRFEEISGAGVKEDCGVITYTARQPDGGSGYMDLNPTVVAGPIAALGNAVHLDEGQYILPTGGPANYTGSFTIQMWVKTAPSWTTMTLWADWHDTADGGTNLAITSGGTFYATVLYPVGQSKDLSFAWPTDGAWHHVRFVRNAAAARIELCLDGKFKGSTPLSGSLDLTSDTPPFIGRNVTYNPPYFIGDIDDVRLFARALPCQ